MITPGGDSSVIGNPNYNPYAGLSGYFDTGGGSFGNDYGWSSGWGDWNPWGSTDTGGGEDDGSGWYGSGGSSGWGGPSVVAGGLALGGLLGSLSNSRNTAGRNLPAEISGILGLAPTAAANTAAVQGQISPYLTRLNTANFASALGGTAANLRTGYNLANPELTNFTAGLGSELARINAMGVDRVHPLGYAATTADPASASFTSAGPAAQAGFGPATAYTAATALANATTAGQQRASGGPLLGTLERDAARALGGTSPIQTQLQQQAMDLVGTNGGLSAQDLRNITQDTRGAFAARGLYDSNPAIAAEVLNTDAARRNRLFQNAQFGQGIDAAGQQQIAANRGYALGVQGQRQGLNTFNAGQGNQIGQFNAGLLTNTSQFNAGQANDIARFNADLQTRNSQFNSGLGAQLSQFNAGAQNNMAQFNSGQANDMSRYNAGLLQNANMFNAGANNTAQQYNTDAVNRMNMFSANLNAQNANDQWGRAMQLGGLLQGQAINPAPIAMGLIGQAPDYTGGLLGYGQDLYNTNFNANSAANISRGNNNAALAAAGLQALLSLYGGS